MKTIVKTIQNPQVVSVYICEGCQTEYHNSWSAKHCETKHAAQKTKTHKLPNGDELVYLNNDEERVAYAAYYHGNYMEDGEFRQPGWYHFETLNDESDEVDGYNLRTMEEYKTSLNEQIDSLNLQLEEMARLK